MSPLSLPVTPRRRENGVGLPADAVYSLGIVSPSMSLVSGLDLVGSRTVASSTPVRFSVPLTDAPGQPAPVKSGLGWRTREVRTVPEVIVDDDHELVIERVCAIDVAKASGKVCMRCSSATPCPCRRARPALRRTVRGGRSGRRG